MFLEQEDSLMTGGGAMCPFPLKTDAIIQENIKFKLSSMLLFQTKKETDKVHQLAKKKKTIIFFHLYRPN